MADKKTQLAVIGGGPGGYAAAFMAADLGLEVTLIDPEKNPGGVCLYRGCIPSKALLHAAKVIEEAREAKAWGLHFSGLKIQPAKLQDWKDGVVARLTGGLGQLVKQRKINYLQATAAFKDNRTLAVKEADGRQSSLAFEYAVIATGSQAAAIAGFEVDSERLLDATAALNLRAGPQKVAGDRRRLYRPGTGNGICRAGLPGDGCGNDRQSAAGSRSVTWSAFCKNGWQSGWTPSCCKPPSKS